MNHGNHQYRPPLAAGLFAEEVLNVTLLDRYPRAAPVVARVRLALAEHVPLESVLEELRTETSVYPRRSQQLLGVQFYLRSLLSECSENWSRLHGGVTNYAMLELAQPTHAFDGELVRAIRVAQMGAPGKFTTLDGQERQMLPDDLLIWNEKEPVALAGIMGGLHSEVRGASRRSVLKRASRRPACDWEWPAFCG